MLKPKKWVRGLEMDAGMQECEETKKVEKLIFRHK